MAHLHSRNESYQAICRRTYRIRTKAAFGPSTLQDLELLTKAAFGPCTLQDLELLSALAPRWDLSHELPSAPPQQDEEGSMVAILHSFERKASA